ncbi:hypothetical protein [Chitinophaga sp. S165]|uniref:hypothetical protein n=1 Tax=Chitinophaga sp. S165 TaxID=2135462 RepID=UPI000D71344D|nr:hypothetical protein [Chitinophaga sp. S165]PWV51397.1 hypothetical protein C7475_1035 [Chitinophaga sp. S165]
MINKQEIIKRNLDKISTFMNNDDLEKSSKQLLDMLYAAMSSRYMDEVSLQAREDMMHFYTVLLGLVEGIHWIGDAMIDLFKEHISQDATDIKIQCPYEDYLNTAL